MSRKHRADNQPVTRRYVRSVVQRARDEILSAVMHQPQPIQPSMVTFTTVDESHAWADTDHRQIYGNSPLVSIERIERAVNGGTLPSFGQQFMAKGGQLSDAEKRMVIGQITRS